MYKPLNKSLLFIFIGLLLSLFSFSITIGSFSIPVGLVASFVFILIGCNGLKDKFEWAKKLFIIEIIAVCGSFGIGFAIGLFVGLNEELLDAFNHISLDGLETAFEMNYYAELIRNHATELNIIFGLTALVDIVVNAILVYAVYNLYCEVIDKVQVRYSKSRFKKDAIWIFIGQTVTSVANFLQTVMFVSSLSEDIVFTQKGNTIEVVGLTQESTDFYNMMNAMCVFVMILMFGFAIVALVFIIRRLIASYKVYKEVNMLEMNGYRYGMVFENATVSENNSESTLESEKVQETSEDSQNSDEPKSFL